MTFYEFIKGLLSQKYLNKDRPTIKEGSDDDAGTNFVKPLLANQNRLRPVGNLNEAANSPQIAWPEVNFANHSLLRYVF